jgi:2-hydroxychromene-2-carboxylate isomerase
MNSTVIEFFFDIGSPYSYLAATQVAPLQQATGAPVRWRPFLLGGVFKASGNETPANVASKALYMAKDLERWARHYQVPFSFSSRFPLSTLITQRAIVAAEQVAGADAAARFAMALFTAYWVQDRDITSPKELGGIADDCRLDVSSLLQAASDPSVKDRLRADTDEAVSRGAFGAPTFFVGQHMFWGNDRIPMIEALLAT